MKTGLPSSEPTARRIHTRKRLERLRRGIERARTMDELFDLQRMYGPIDEADAGAEELCYELRAAACYLSGGPPPSRAMFRLTRPAPPEPERTFTVRGRIGERIAAVVWADGRLYGSLYALARLEARPADDGDPLHALERIVAAFDDVAEAPAGAAFDDLARRVA